MISVNWAEIIRLLLLIFGGIGTAGIAVQWAVKNKPAPKPDPKPTDPESPALPVRSADEPPPVGAQQWVADICAAMSGAGSDTILESLRQGETRDQARARRIAELEGRSDAVEPA